MTTNQTQPTPDFTFQQSSIAGHVAITNKDGETEEYSFATLKRMAASIATPETVRAKAAAALKWAGQS